MAGTRNGRRREGQAGNLHQKHGRYVENPGQEAAPGGRAGVQGLQSGSLVCSVRTAFGS